MQVDARDAEGRTALHLAAGCGDSAMVLQLVQLGSDVNCRDSVGGRLSDSEDPSQRLCSTASSQHQHPCSSI